MKLLYVATERQKKGEPTKFDFFDADFKHLPVMQEGHPNASQRPIKPSCFEEMKCLAKKLGQGIPHVRVDFYQVGQQIYFGEMTFYSMSGMFPFKPREWDNRFGEFLNLPIR